MAVEAFACPLGGMDHDAEHWEDFGQKVDLTARIREILINYPEGTSILKELIQVGRRIRSSLRTWTRGAVHWRCAVLHSDTRCPSCGLPSPTWHFRSFVRSISMWLPHRPLVSFVPPLRFPVAHSGPKADDTLLLCLQ